MHSLYPAAPDPIRRWSQLRPGHAAVVDRARASLVTYAELDLLIDQHAGLLRALHVVPGDIVATLGSNRIEQVALFFACARVGAALAPLNWRLAHAELAPILHNARPRLLFGETRYRAVAEQALASAGTVCRWIDLDSELPHLLHVLGATSVAERAVQPDDAVLVLYTSGTTGTPKGAVLPHRQILFNAIATTTSWLLGADDVAPVSTPLFHTGGWNVFATPLWYRGGTVVLFDGFDADDFLHGMAEHRCTVALTVPTQLVMLAESPAWGMPLPALRTFFSGGAPLPATVGARVRAAGYRLREGYGLTECGPNCFALPAAAGAAERPGVVGWPVHFLDARIVDDAGIDVGGGEAGELWLRGPQRFAGYLHDGARSAEAITADGWLRTGDLARREADGAFIICGRRKEMFISGGENVYPAEIEAVLADHAAVLECAVVGVPDERWGEVGRAFVVLRPHAARDAEGMLRHVRARLAGYKTPRSVLFVDALPRLGSGKIDRAALAQLHVPADA